MKKNEVVSHILTKNALYNLLLGEKFKSQKNT